MDLSIHDTSTTSPADGVNDIISGFGFPPRLCRDLEFCRTLLEEGALVADLPGEKLSQNSFVKFRPVSEELRDI